MARLTVDIPRSLHVRLKTSCAQNQQKITEVVRALLEEHLRKAA
jgi:hypothetical protein